LSAGRRLNFQSFTAEQSVDSIDVKTLIWDFKK